MQNRKLIKLNTGFIFDYTSMIGDNRITENDLLKNKYYSCIAGIDIILINPIIGNRILWNFFLI